MPSHCIFSLHYFFNFEIKFHCGTSGRNLGGSEGPCPPGKADPCLHAWHTGASGEHRHHPLQAFSSGGAV